MSAEGTWDMRTAGEEEARSLDSARTLAPLGMTEGSGTPAPLGMTEGSGTPAPLGMTEGSGTLAPLGMTGEGGKPVELTLSSSNGLGMTGGSGTLAPTGRPRSLAWLANLGERLAFVMVLALAAALNTVGLDREAFANTYYAAAVKSMLTSWPAFFFASFDGAGFVTVDKPPVGLWVQAASAKLFGFSGLSLLLPQAIAGVLAVAVLCWLVRRAYGPAAGLLAGLALAVTPITVVTDRNNTMDSQLVLVLLLAAWAASLAAERGRLRLLLLCAALVGLAYNVKMLQAYLVLPALWGVYLLWAPLRLRTRLGHLALATVVLLAVSLSWSAAVDLTPADARPYIGSSGSNSALSLALGYNGLGRLTSAVASRLPIPWLDGLTVDLTAAPGFAPGIGNPGPLRLFQGELAGQASWLLPLALFGVLVAGYQLFSRPHGSARRAPRSTAPDLERRQRVALTLWTLWLVGTAGYFSVARFYHIYYLIMLGPGVAALAGIGIAACWHAYRRGWRGAWLLPSGLAICAVAQAMLLAAYPEWSARLLPVVLGGVGAAVPGLVLGRLLRRWRHGGSLAAVATGVGCLALLAAPTVWSAVSVQNNSGAAWLPQAGPRMAFGLRGGPGGGPSFGGGPAPFQPGGMPAGFGGPGFGAGRSQAPGQGGPDGAGRAFRGPGGGPGGGPRGGQGAMTFAGEQWDSLDQELVRYLLANQGAATFLVATPTSSYASLFILATDQPAMALGGYQGWDRIVTPERLATLVSDGVVRFFWINGDGGFGNGPGNAPGRGQGFGAGQADGRGGQPDGQGMVSSSQDATGDLLAWVRSSCEVVPAEEWQAPGPDVAEPADTGPIPRGPGNRTDPRGQQLYDCGALIGRG